MKTSTAISCAARNVAAAAAIKAASLVNNPGPRNVPPTVFADLPFEVVPRRVPHQAAH